MLENSEFITIVKATAAMRRSNLGGNLPDDVLAEAVQHLADGLTAHLEHVPDDQVFERAKAYLKPHGGYLLYSPKKDTYHLKVGGEKYYLNFWVFGFKAATKGDEHLLLLYPSSKKVERCDQASLPYRKLVHMFHEQEPAMRQRLEDGAKHMPTTAQ